MKKRSNMILMILIFIMMILLAMFDNVRGPFVPTFKEEFLVDNKGISLMVLMCSLGYTVFTFVGGILCEKLGQKKVFIFGFIFLICPLLALHFCTNFLSLVTELLVLNIGQAFIAIAANTITPLIAVSFQAILMNFTHFCYGVGATFTQKFTGKMLSMGVQWREVYLLLAIITSVIFIAVIFAPVPNTHNIKKKESIDIKSILKNKLIYLYMVVLGMYVAAEINTGVWFVNFMHDTYNFSVNKCSSYASLFFGTFALGRLLGGFVAEKFGYIKTILASVFIAFILYILGILLREKGVIIIACSGMFFAIVFPTVIVTISKVFKKNTSFIIGLVTMVSSATSMLVNILIGSLSDLLGAYRAYYVIPTCLLICAIFMYFIYLNTKNILKENRREQNVL